MRHLLLTSSLLVVVAVVLSVSACGGDDDAADAADGKTTGATSQSTVTVPSAAVVGTWADGSFIVRLTDDGEFSIDNDGSLENGEFVNGTYSVEGSKLSFVADELGPRGCGGQEWEWEVALSDSGTLAAELLQGVCQTDAGTKWFLMKRPA
jgi:hypothetical protein